MNETLKTISELRTVHGNFSDKDISTENLQTILEASTRAANSSARQSYSIIVIDDKEMMMKLCGYSGSSLLLFCVDYTRLSDVAHHMGHDFDRKDFTGFITGSTDTILAAQTAAIAAKSLGLDSLFTNGIHRGDPNRVYELLDLPLEQCFPLIALVLGYAETDCKVKKARITEGVIHYGRYRHLSVAEMDKLVGKYDDPHERLVLSQGWKQEYDRYLDWFFTRWSVKGDTLPIRKLIEQTGFLNRVNPTSSEGL